MSVVPPLAWAAPSRVLVAAVALLLPGLLTTTSGSTGPLAIGVLAFALAALIDLGLRCGARTDHRDPAVRPPGHHVAPVLTGRVTDPVHHPLRPRAPGPA